jgi:hypothetical protein
MFSKKSPVVLISAYDALAALREPIPETGTQFFRWKIQTWLGDRGLARAACSSHR